MKKIFLLIFFVAGCGTMAQQNPVLPADPVLKTGKLKNGLTYYIHHNKTPEKRADFYIAQKVGSMQEEDAQAGLAHFLEHMAFNGTRNFPGKTMLDYLENNGVKFGTNINAYTSFDETVYYLSNVPTTNQNLLDSCLLVLHDWSCGILLEADELEKERGVIREEWRTRGGAQQRLTEKLLPELFRGSKYAERMPIGSIDVINNFKPEEIRAYYRKWYCPDLQGIIIVGDVDVEATEKKIKDLFESIPLDEERAQRTYYPVPDNEEPVAVLATDKEAQSTSILLYYKHDPLPFEIRNTQAGYIQNYITTVASMMMNERFRDISQKPDAPFTSAFAYDDNYFIAKTKDAWTVVAGSAEDKIKNALRAIATETERVKQHGFTASEYDRARTNILNGAENAYNNRDKQKNSYYSQKYVRHFTDGEPVPGIEYEYRLLQSVAPQIPVEVVNQAIQQLIGDKNIVLAITGPEKEDLLYPDNEELLQILLTIRNDEVEPYAEETFNRPLIDIPPVAGTLVEARKDEDFDATVWRLSNGVTVILKKTDFKDDQILMAASSHGGTSSYALQDPVNSKMAGQVAPLGGVGDFSLTELPKVLAGKNISISPLLGIMKQGFNGTSSQRDFETLLQLVYLYFTSPRTDQDAFESFLQRAEIQLKNAEAEPSVAFQDTITRKLYHDNPLFDRLKAEDMDKINYGCIMEMFRQSFSNPGSFVFAFVGNIDEEAVKPFILQYLGSIPGKYARNRYEELPMDIAKGTSETIFQREMENSKASVFNIFSGQSEFTRKNNIIISMLRQIMDIVYTEKIREEEGGTYGVSTSGSIARYPEGQTILQINFDTDPDKARTLNKLVKGELRAMAEHGPRAEDFSKVKEYMLKAYNENIRENKYWLNQLIDKYFYDWDRHTHYLDALNAIKPEDIQTFVRDLLAQENEKTVVMLPATTD